MTDRELLEAAARAAGIVGCWEAAANNGKGMFIQQDGRCWIPLTDDGDALRLSVKLWISPSHYDNVVCAARGGLASPFVTVPVGDDRCAATRRAIVGVAAVIDAMDAFHAGCKGVNHG